MAPAYGKASWLERHGGRCNGRSRVPRTPSPGRLGNAAARTATTTTRRPTTTCEGPSARAPAATAHTARIAHRAPCRIACEKSPRRGSLGRVAASPRPFRRCGLGVPVLALTPQPETQNPYPETRHPNPKPFTLLKPSTLKHNPKPYLNRHFRRSIVSGGRRSEPKPVHRQRAHRRSTHCGAWPRHWA